MQRGSMTGRGDENDVLLKLKIAASKVKNEDLTLLEGLIEENPEPVSEASLTVTSTRIILTACISADISAKEDYAGKQQRTFPDYVIYLNALANHNYESFMEVKWPEQMNKEEDDTVKLRKQMQFALNKLVDAGVEDPLIVGLTIEVYMRPIRQLGDSLIGYDANM
ncbi:hypothetical protein VTP01DRAFT_4334 [Rhizomucor pusillus]|uniref:uncharacterized protein n=1 Tax=Rhizomucor pusillus TaxID=4840 RepID=UPI003743E4BF